MSLNPISHNAVPESAVVLLSGGLDSTVALADLIAQGCRIDLVITFSYGQRAFFQEKKAAAAITDHYQLRHVIVELPWFSKLLPETMDETSESVDWQQSRDVKSVWVPNRNGVFLNIGAAYAEALGAEAVAFGANQSEAVDFPDNTQAYRDAVSQSLSFSTLSKVQVCTPVSHLSKAEIVAHAQKIQAPLALIWSCYEAAEDPCGQCPSCLRLKEALNV